MPSPFDSSAFDRAVAPFFSEPVAFFATRPDGEHRGTVRASVFDEGYEEPLDDSAVSTSSRIGLLTLLIRRLDWAAALSTPPQSGDRFVSPATGKTYALKTVTHFARDIWTVAAREVAP